MLMKVFGRTQRDKREDADNRDKSDPDELRIAFRYRPRIRARAVDRTWLLGTELRSLDLS
jgi:hypothetical protein